MSAATLKRLDPTQVELEIALSEAELASARERAFRELSKNAKLPGFRPGKIPRRLFEAQYGTAQIEERALDALVPDAYSKALNEHDLSPVDQPDMQLLPFEEGQPVRVRATVAVRPTFEPHDYKGLTLEGPSTAVSDEDVLTALQGMRKEAGTLVPVERPVELGDVPTIDYEGTIDGVAFEGGTAQNQPTELIAENYIPGFASGIVGMSAGETKDVSAEFPDPYSNPELAGKSAVFTITVHDVKVRELAVLDEEFARRFGPPEATIDSLKDELRNRLEANARNRQRRELATVAVDRLADLHDFALPPVLVDRELEGLVGEAKSYVERAGMTWDDYLHAQAKTEDELRAEYGREARKRVKGTLLLEAIAKLENVAAANEDIDREIDQLSAQYRQPKGAVIEMVRPNLQAFLDGIVRGKTIDLILEHAKITERVASDTSNEGNFEEAADEAAADDEAVSDEAASGASENA